MRKGVLARDAAPRIPAAWLADRWPDRLRGLLFRSRLADDGSEALVLRPCNSVHTLGMRYPLDIVFLDRAGRICGLREGIGPSRFAMQRGAAATVEFHAGAIGRLGLRMGECLAWQAA